MARDHIIQHQPIRIPESDWNKGKRDLAIQIEQILDDIYARLSHKAENVLASGITNGLMSAADFNKLQFVKIPANSNLFAYCDGYFTMLFATAAIAATLTNCPTTNAFVMLNIGERFLQRYNLLIDTDSNPPRYWGRTPGSGDDNPWTELMWTSDATRTVHGLMPAADKVKVNHLNYLRIADDDTTPWKTAGGRQASPGLWVVRNQGVLSWAAQQYSSAIAFGEADTHGYIGIGYSNAGEGKVAFAGGSTTNSTDAGPKWYWKLKGTSLSEYDLDEITEYSSTTFSSIKDATNVTSGTGTVRKYAHTVNINFGAVLAANLNADEFLQIATLASTYRPQEEINTTVVTGTTSPMVGRLKINTNGTMFVKFPIGIDAGDEVMGNVVYVR